MKFKFLTSLLVIGIGLLLSFGGYHFTSVKTANHYQFKFQTLVTKEKEELHRGIQALEGQLTMLSQLSLDSNPTDLSSLLPASLQGKISRLLLVEHIEAKRIRSFKNRVKRSSNLFKIWPKQENKKQNKRNLFVVKQEWGKHQGKSLLGLNLFSIEKWKLQEEVLLQRELFANYQNSRAPHGLGLSAVTVVIPLKTAKKQWLVMEVALEVALSHLSSQAQIKDENLDFQVYDAKGNVQSEFQDMSPLPGYQNEISFRFFGLHYGVKYQVTRLFVPEKEQNLPFIVVTVILLSVLLLLAYFLFLVAKIQEEIRIKQSKDKLAKFYEASILASKSANSIEEMLQIVLQKICEYAGWPIGHVYLPDSLKQSTQSDIWHFRESETYGFFKIHYESPNFMTGESLIDRALAHEQSVWINNIALDNQFTKSKVRKDMGIGAAIGLPLWVNEEVTAVLEFFADEALELNEQLLSEVEGVVNHLGEYIERQWAKTQIFTSVDLNRKVLDAIYEPVVVVGKKGEIRLLNIPAEKMFGYKEKDIKGMGVELLIGQPFNLELKKAFIEYHETGRLISLGEGKVVQGKKKGGAVFPSLLRLNEVRVQDDALVVATFGSVAEAEQPPTELTFSEQPIAATSVSNLSFYSHQPLTGEDTTLFAVSERIQKSLGELLSSTLPKKVQKEIRSISYSTQELHEALECLMDLSRFEKGGRSLERLHFNLTDMLNQVLLEVGPRIYAQNLELITEYQGAIPEDYIGDPAKISLCIKMMITNALQYTTKGHLKLLVKCQMSDMSQAKLMFIVQDTGCGVDQRRLQEIRVQLFEKGMQTKKNHAIGLTLTYAKNLAELLQGGVGLASPGLDQGAELSLTVLLPRQRKEEKDLILKKSLGGEKLLLWSENAALSSSLRSRLVYDGAEVAEVNSLDSLEELYNQAYEQGDPFGWVLINAPSGQMALDSMLERFQKTRRNSRLLLFVEPNLVTPELQDCMVMTKPVSAKEPNLIMEEILNQVVE